MKLSEILEEGMPSSVVKSKQHWEKMVQNEPEKLKAHIEGLTKLKPWRGMTPYEVALDRQWTHGYGKDNKSGPYAKLFSDEEKS